MTNTTPARPVYDVTTKGHPNETVTVIIDCTEMRVPYRSWLQMEIERWHEKNYREAWVAQDKEGMIWLQSWSEYQKPVGEEGE